ncbi:sterile alpha motif domain-containing 9-like protein [Labeo rohita]|uniref:Sterile alpha motif domain-containing 9-like protein n=1 Tax=Labeo rohita TaxID=84645 RepID=A0A498L9A9_LABRO|nr:sterile alpha motif domain-containing 9-like protein [Labeo rohita]RXN04960.1 sterile alpha motif domain-containing 9-like protein [Labeo rohita]
MFESEVIDSNVCRKYETDFLKGAPPQWLNFYTSSNSPLVERDHFKDLKQLVEEKRGKRRLITEVSLQYQPGSGGSTLAMQVLWHFRKDLRCARVIDSSLDAKELSKQVVDLFLLSNKERDQKTVLLLLDIQGNTNDDLLIKSILRQNLNKDIHERNITTNTPVVIIFNCSPADLLTIGHSTDDVKLTMKLLTDEKLRFAQKKKQLTTKYKKMSQKFHAFNIMQGGFQKKDAEDLITKEIKEYVINHKEFSSTRLLIFLALKNSYVPGSHLSKLFCEEFMDRTEQLTGEEKPTLETIMKPFMDLIVIFSEDEQKGQCIRLAHPLIADACLKMFTEHNVARSDIALDFLNSLVKGNERNYGQICERMLITRLATGKNKQRFSRLILDIIEDNKTNDCIRLLEWASDLFSTDPYYPQTLARLYYIAVKENNKYEEARKWAEEAINRDPNKSDIKDTLGQVYKKHLQTFSDIKACWDIAKCAIQAFKDEAKAAEEQAKENTKFNYRGYYGFLQVCSVIHEISTKNPSEHTELEHSEFISGLKSDVEMKYDFFEWYLTFSRPNISKENPEYIREHVDKCYIHYFKVGTQTDEATLNEKKMKSFGGLLNILKLDIDVLKENWSAIENPQPDNESQTVLYILANVILSQSGKPCANAENLQARLQKLWESNEQDRSPEFYLLILLLFWPYDAQPAIVNHPNLENCVEYLSQSYERNYQKYLCGRYLMPLFFFGKGEGLQRLIHTSELHQIDRECLTEGHEKAEVECLQRINGRVENNKVLVVRDGQEIQVTAHNWVSMYKPGQVSFYLGFNIRGPVAYNIRYEENGK